MYRVVFAALIFSIAASNGVQCRKWRLRENNYFRKKNLRRRSCASSARSGASNAARACRDRRALLPVAAAPKSHALMATPLMIAAKVSTFVDASQIR